MKKSVFQVVSQRLNKVEFKLDPNYKFSQEKVPLELDFHTDINKHADKPLAEVSLTLKLFSKTESAPFYCTVSYQGLFAWDQNVPSNSVDKYLNCNAVAMLYSFIRPVVSNLTALSNLPPLTIPFMNFIEEENDKED